MGLVPLLWRALAVFRIAALGYALVLILRDVRGYDRPGVAWLIAAGMVAWTVLISWVYADPIRRRWPVLAADLVVAAAALAVSPWVIGPREQTDTLPAVWTAAPVVAWALRGGWRGGAAAAVIVAAMDIAIRRDGTTVPQVSINATVLLLFLGVIVGYMAKLAGQAEQQLQSAVEREAATRERERLARGIHDSVLQVLALVQRRGAELGGEAARLGRLAGEQEATLRALVTGEAPALAPPSRQGVSDAGSGGEVSPAGRPVDLAAALRERFAGPGVIISAPADPVPLPATLVVELAAAVAAALDNVRAHGGRSARAWLLVEGEPTQVTVTIRDDGPGIPSGRLAQAAAEGRLGVTQSIVGRLRDLGGVATVTSVPDQGTEVELRLPLP